MRTTRLRPILIATALLASAAQAGPNTAGAGIDLQMLDLNGAPFGPFHLGHFAAGLDAASPRAAGPMPSEALSRELSSATPAERYTGVDARPASPLPHKPDLAPLLDRYDDSLLQPAPGAN